MDLNSLYIFSKDTDAYSAQRGYNFQVLKTLETWVYNYNNNINEEIYCEYEEDIFQKDLLNRKVKFRQIKLYSSNFSFSSEEVRKSIFHFFMLHIKSDYTDFKKEFIFETNSNIAKNYSENDAKLLKDWFENQNKLDEENLKKYSIKIKGIVTDYIEVQKGKRKKGDDVNLINEAVKLFSKLDDVFWVNFTKLIKWEFIGTTPDEEYSDTKTRIENLILSLPFTNIIEEKIKESYGVLLEKVFTTSTNENSENRKLSNNKLETTILEIGDDDDKWYSKKYEYYSKIEKIEFFRVGEYYEVLDLVNYCRRKKYLHKHKSQWNSFLEFYCKNNSIQNTFRLNAIYELIFLNLNFYEVDYEKLKTRERPEGNLSGYEKEIIYYFQDYSLFKTIDELEKPQNLLNIIFSDILEKKIKISEEQLKKWIVSLFKEINIRLVKVKNIDEKCSLLEQKGNFLFVINRVRYNKDYNEFIKYYYKLLRNIENAPFYPLSRLGDRINKYIKTQINIDPKDEMGIINTLENFSEKLFPYVEKREGKIKLAKQQVLRGVSYLHHKEPSLLLKALEYFHLAKDNYQHKDTIEGYILALLNISQVYSVLGMHFASKYYALGAFRISINNELIKRIETSLGLMFYSDYKQGSWFNAINIYDKYIFLRDESNIEKTGCLEESKITQRLSFMLYTMKRKSNQLTHFIDGYINHLGYIGNDIVLPIFKKLDFELKEEKKFNKLLSKNIDDFPINDIDKIRTISFYALGSLWNIKFKNEYKITSVAEEFISSMQIIFAEISLFEVDFHLLKSEVELELELSSTYKSPVQLPNNNIVKQKVFIKYFENKNFKKLNKHAVFTGLSINYILKSISLLKENEFTEKFMLFIKDRGLDKKQVSVNLYQRIHRDVYYKKDFDLSRRVYFQKEDFKLNFLKENNFMKWNDKISEKYNYKNSIKAIKTTFNNVRNGTYKTIENLIKEKEFHHLINNLREEGWKDWQIMGNMFNFMIGYKLQVFEHKNLAALKGLNEINYNIEHRDLYYKYGDMDEKDCYINFPVEAFESEEFKVQFKIGIIYILNRFDLECNLDTPPFSLIREFLNVKFNLSKDDFNENNPLVNI